MGELAELGNEADRREEARPLLQPAGPAHLVAPRLEDHAARLLHRVSPQSPPPHAAGHWGIAFQSWLM